MPSAYTIDDGSPHSFTSRKALYEWMIENGHVILEGDDAKIFDAVVSKSKNPKSPALAARIADERGV